MNSPRGSSRWGSWKETDIEGVVRSVNSGFALKPADILHDGFDIFSADVLDPRHIAEAEVVGADPSLYRKLEGDVGVKVRRVRL